MRSFLDEIIEARCCKNPKIKLAACMDMGKDGCTVSLPFLKKKTKEPKTEEIEKPQLIESWDFDDHKPIRDICEEYIDFVWDDDQYHEDNDYDRFIAETVMITLFGEDVYEKINKKRP